ncbi:AMP-binding protein [Desertimonas flava]|uniref:AMP-binding protein n=1 Tax=Desertimonas flava TaxID=2064846 RepID=UPI001D0C4F9B|nr:AMP-binding protein [Desertimonas flava]
MPAFASRLAEERPDEFALTDPSGSMTWAQVGAVLDRVANGLGAVDLGPRRRVAVFAENASETALAHLGGLIGGASTVPVNFHLTADETAYILRDSETRVLFVGPETVERGLAAARAAGVDTVVAWGLDAAVAGTIPWSEWLAAAPDDEPDDGIAPLPNLLYTSGTTGVPKGTELPPTMFAGGGTVAEHLEALRGNAFARYGTHLVVGPMYHTGPLSGMRLLVAGVPSVILGRFDAERTLATIEEHRTESAVMVPTHFVRLLALPDDVRGRYDVSSMQYVAHTGASCPVDVKRAMIDWWGPIFVDAYGASEVGTTCSINSVDWLGHPGSVGRPLPPFEVLVLDDDDREVPAGTEGRLYFRDLTGRGVVYPNDPEKTAAAHIAEGVFTLGEIGYVDDEGFVYITDRFSDMVVSGGANIYPAEAEKVLLQHAGVADVACIGVPHAEMGEELRGLVVPADPASPPDPAELVAFCRERLSHYKCPRTIELVDDLGRNTMGKLNKRRLRAPYWSQHPA